MALFLLFNLSIMHFKQFSNYALLIGELRVKQTKLLRPKKVQNSANCPKPSLAVDIPKNVPIMHKTLALREESKIFKGNQLIQDD